MAKKKQLQYQEMSLFDGSFFEDISSKGDELLSVEQNKETPVKKKSEKQLYFEELEENARQKMEKAVRTGKAVNVSMPIDEKLRVRGKRQRLKVSFADGTIVCDVSATITMMQVIDKIGVERVAALGMEVCHVTFGLSGCCSSICRMD